LEEIGIINGNVIGFWPTFLRNFEIALLAPLMTNFPLRKNLGHNLTSGILMLVATLPLVVGVSIASGANGYVGIFTSVIGGVVLSFSTRSNYIIYGPTSYLVAIVLAATMMFGYYQVMISIVLAGIMQYLIGLLKGGNLVSYLPKILLKGIITGSGILAAYKGIRYLIENNSTGNFFNYYFFLILFLLGVLIVLFHFFGILRLYWLGLALIFSILTIVLFLFIGRSDPGVVPDWFIGTLKDSPVYNQPALFITSIKDYNFKTILTSGFTIAIVSSLISILSIGAIAISTPEKDINYDKHLKSLGIANIISGLLGGLPIGVSLSQSMANYYFGARSHYSSLYFTLGMGIFLFIPEIDQIIPVQGASILLIVVFIRIIDLPFILKTVTALYNNQVKVFYATAIAIVIVADLLKGIAIGWAMDIFLFYAYYSHIRNSSEPIKMLPRDELPETTPTLPQVWHKMGKKLKWLPEAIGIIVFSLAATYLIFKSKLLPYEGHWGTFGGIFALVLMVVDSIRRNKKNDNKPGES
jgi:MFS superfamily sulfate permease-like transporter